MAVTSNDTSRDFWITPLGGKDRGSTRILSALGGTSRELLELFATNQLRVAVVMPALAVLFASFSLIWGMHLEAIAWLAVVFVAQGYQLIVCRQFERDSHAGTSVGEWIGRLATTELIYALTWASALFIFWSPVDPVQNIFVIAVMIFAITIRLVIAGHCVPIVLAGTAPIALAVALRCTLEGEAFYLALALLVIVGELCFIHLAKTLQRTARDMLTFKAQKEALIGELANEKAVAEAARQRAEAASIAKSRFLATMSHELRTPLNAILGFSEIVKSEMLGPIQIPAYRGYAEDIHQSGQHLLSLIDEILDLSRIEAGRYDLNEEQLSLGEVAHECHHLLALKAEQKDVRIIEEFEPDVPDVLADRRAIRQIWINLISNAIKFTPAGGKIRLRIRRGTYAGVEFSVADNGPGIPEEEIPAVLSAFGQGSSAHHGKQEGVGLGLPIVQGLVLLHEGVLDIRSREGRGTEIVTSLPASRVIDTGQDVPGITSRPSNGQRLLMAVTR